MCVCSQEVELELAWCGKRMMSSSLVNRSYIFMKYTEMRNGVCLVYHIETTSSVVVWYTLGESFMK